MSAPAHAAALEKGIRGDAMRVPEAQFAIRVRECAIDVPDGSTREASPVAARYCGMGTVHA